MPTSIEWVRNPNGTQGETWNPVTGCTPVSEGCEHCYAARMAKRLAGRFGYPKDDPFRVTLHPDRLEEPLGWKKPRKIFVCSMGDLFHPDVPFEYLADVWDTMFDADRHTFMILTKRPERMLLFANWMQEKARRIDYPSVWLGVTAENQRTANERIPLLLGAPAALRFVSVEPMLGPVSLTQLENKHGRYDSLEGCGVDNRNMCQSIPNVYGNHLDWVICGAETRSGVRPMDYHWGRYLRDECAHVGILFFFKKGNGGEEPPEDLRIREWPMLPKKPEV